MQSGQKYLLLDFLNLSNVSFLPLINSRSYTCRAHGQVSISAYEQQGYEVCVSYLYSGLLIKVFPTQIEFTNLTGWKL